MLYQKKNYIQVVNTFKGPSEIIVKFVVVVKMSVFSFVWFIWTVVNLVLRLEGKISLIV